MRATSLATSRPKCIFGSNHRPTRIQLWSHSECHSAAKISSYSDGPAAKSVTVASEPGNLWISPTPPSIQPLFTPPLKLPFLCLPAQGPSSPAKDRCQGASSAHFSFVCIANAVVIATTIVHQIATTK